MDQISELRTILNGCFQWNKARITCFVEMLLALFIVRTVNLNKIAWVGSNLKCDNFHKYCIFIILTESEHTEGEIVAWQIIVT